MMSTLTQIFDLVKNADISTVSDLINQMTLLSYFRSGLVRTFLFIYFSE